VEIVSTLLGYIGFARRYGVLRAIATWRESDRLYAAFRASYGRDPEPYEFRNLGERCQSWRVAQGRSLSRVQIRRLVEHV